MVRVWVFINCGEILLENLVFDCGGNWFLKICLVFLVGMGYVDCWVFNEILILGGRDSVYGNVWMYLG